MSYILPDVCVKFLIEEAEKYGVENITIGVMQPGAGPLGLPKYRGVICESIEKLRASLQQTTEHGK